MVIDEERVGKDVYALVEVTTGKFKDMFVIRCNGRIMAAYLTLETAQNQFNKLTNYSATVMNPNKGRQDHV